MSNSNDEILTIEEAARFLKIGKTTLYKLARKNKMPAQKIGREWRFLKSGIVEWMKKDHNKK